MHVRRFSVDLEISFTQVYKPILDEVKLYFDRQGISGGVVYTERGGRISRLVFVSNTSVLRVLVHLLPVLMIRRRQAEATIDYLSDKLTGSDFLGIMNQEIASKGRKGKNHPENQPWLRSVGIMNSRLESMRRARQVYQEMRQSPGMKELEKAHAIAWNKHRGMKTQESILCALCRGPMTIDKVADKISRSYHRTKLLMKEMYDCGLLDRNRECITVPFQFVLTPTGQHCLSLLDGGYPSENPSPI